MLRLPQDQYPEPAFIERGRVIKARSGYFASPNIRCRIGCSAHKRARPSRTGKSSGFDSDDDGVAAALGAGCAG